MSTLTTNYQFILPAVNNPIDADRWGGDLNTDWSNADGYILGANTGNIGNSAPTIPATAAPTGGMTWVDNTANPWVIKIYDGTNWVMTGSINTTDHIYSNVGNIAVNVQAFTTAGSYTYTPSVGMSYCIIEMVGGGGGSDYLSFTGAGLAVTGGGGGGQYTRQIFTLAQIGAGVSLVVGAGGVAGTSGNPGGTGGYTAMVSGSGVYASGGFASSNVSAVAGTTAAIGGLGASVSGGSIGFLTVSGNQGSPGIGIVGVTAFGGAGGASFFGGGGAGAPSSAGTYAAPTTPGAGAGGGAIIGASGGTRNGVAGAPGAVIITEFI